ncbi:MAG TPA: RHS repeat-associated core domain-containing protein [Verrucomicrobiae bacterium]
MKTPLALCFLALCTPLASTAASGGLIGNQYITQIEAKHIFRSPLEWAGMQEPQKDEASELLAAMDTFQTNGLPAGLDALESFLTAHPQSGWAASLHVLLAEYYGGRGRLTAALGHWQAAWELTKYYPDYPHQHLAARTAAGWGGLLAGLGHQDELAALLQELEELQIPLYSYGTAVMANKARLHAMRSQPGTANACGLLALNRLGANLQLNKLLKRQLLRTPAPLTGFSVAELLELGRTNGIPLEAVRRPAQAELVVPSIIHWKLNHYAVVMDKSAERTLVLDPSFNGELWMDVETIEAEASGVFIVPAGKAPSSWPRLTPTECAAIFGKGYPSGFSDWEDAPPDDCDGGDGSDADCDPPSSNDGGDGGGPPNPPPPCCDGGGDPSDDSDSGSGDDTPKTGHQTGWDQPQYDHGGGGSYLRAIDSGSGAMLAGHGMPRWRISEPYISLWLHDSPLFYHLSNGKLMPLKLTYKQRGEDRGSGIGGFGPKWECNWLGMLYGKDGLNYFTNHLAGGGQQTFNRNGSPEYSSARKVCTSQELPTLRTPTLCGGTWSYTLDGQAAPVGLGSSTGSGNCYSYVVDFPTKETNYFRSYRVDKYGRGIRFNYEKVGAVVRLKNVVDLDGRTNTLGYNNASYPNLITSVTNPYNATCQLVYDNLGRLTNVTDMQGLSSSFKYDTSNNITNLTTPYGETSFQIFEGTNATYGSWNRSLLVTEPSGDHQLYAFCSGGATGVAGDGFPGYRNSFHWDRAQYAAISAQGKTNFLAMPDADYDLAETRHWLHGADGATLSDTLDAMAGPVDPASSSRNPVWTFTYQGQNPLTPWVVGTLKRVTQVWSTGPGPMVTITRNSRGRPEIVTNYFNGNPAAYTNVFDSSGRIVQRQWGNRGELVRGYGYHAVYTNLLTSVTNAVGDVIRYTHDTNTLKVTSIAFPSGLVRTNIYYASGPSQGFLQTQIEIGIRTNSFSYTNGNVWIHTNELGLVTTNLWDNLRRLLSVAFPDGTTISNTYSKLDLTGAKDRLGHWTWYGHNSLGQLTSITNVNGQITRYDYCGCGAPSSITRYLGAQSLPTVLSYDIRGRLTNTIYSDNYQINRAYDATTGMPSSISDSGGRSIDIDYVPLGLNFLLANVYARGGSKLFGQTYDEYGHVLTRIDQNAVTITNGYDTVGRLIGRRAFGPAALQYGTIESGLESFVYNSRGLTNYSDALGHLTSFVRDAAGRLLYETNANTELLQFTYSPAGQLLTLTDGKNQTTTWHYDSYGRVTNKVDAASTEILRYIYNPEGRLTNRWSVAKGTTSYGYDYLGNLTNITYPQSTISYGYDSLNRLTSMVDPVGTTSFTWTDGDQLVSEDGPWNADTVSYTYTSRLRTALSLLQPNASPWVQTYGYDSDGRLTNVTSQAGAFGYQYPDNRFDLIRQLTLPSGAYSSRAYDDLARLTDITLYHPNGTVLDSHGYSYDMGSQRTQQVFTAANFVNYTYDNIGQLKTAAGWEQDGTTPRLHEQFGYDYDRAWNLNYRTNNQLVQTFAVNNLNELTSASRSGTLTVAGALSQSAGVSGVTVSGTGLSSGAANVYADGSWARAGATPANGQNTYNASTSDSYGRTAQDSVVVNLPTSSSLYYDGNGNLTNDGLRTFEYDTENQLTSVTVSSAWRSEFCYDGMMRRRIRKEFSWASGAWLQTNEVHYVYDALLVVQERDARNLPQVTYTRGADLSGGLQEAGGIRGLLARTDSSLAGTPFAQACYHYDGNGNVSCLVNASNIVVALYSYSPFGNLLTKNGPLADANIYRFSTKEIDTASGLLYYACRYYAPNLQRWLNRDPIGGAGGLNLYGFVANNPTHKVDPFGLWFGSCDPSWEADALKMTGQPARSILALEATIDSGANALSYRFPVTVPGNEATRAMIQQQMNAAQVQLRDYRAVGTAGGVGATATAICTVGTLPAGAVLTGAGGCGVAAVGWTGVGLAGVGGVVAGKLVGQIGPQGNTVDDLIQRFFRWAVWNPWYAHSCRK